MRATDRSAVQNRKTDKCDNRNDVLDTGDGIEMNTTAQQLQSELRSHSWQSSVEYAIMVLHISQSRLPRQ